jgi:HEAT repeat protein
MRQSLPVKRSRDLLNRLNALAEDNVELDFTAIFKNALLDTDAEVRKEAIQGLWEDEEPSLIRPLLKILENDSSESVRQAAAFALGRFAVLAECRKISSANVERLGVPLLRLAEDPFEPMMLRRRALEAVAPLSLPEVTRAIWDAYRQDEPEMKAGAIRAMGLNCDLLWLPTILQELGNDKPEIRYEAAISAGELGEVEAVLPLIGLIEDPDPEVRMAAVQGLGAVGGPEAKKALRNVLNYKEGPVRDAASAALSQINFSSEPFLLPGD